MRRSFYHHGAEVPATDLTPEQMRSALADAGGVLWLDLTHMTEEDAREILDGVFKFSEQTILDCLEGVRHPKLDNYGHYLFFVVYASDQVNPQEEITPVELDIYLGTNYVITHHPGPVPAIDRVAERVMHEEFFMGAGADYLVCEILQAVEADYRPAIQFLSAAVAGVEMEVLAIPTKETLRRMYDLRHEIRKIRRVLEPQYSLIQQLATLDFGPIRANNRPCYRRLAERMARMLEQVERLDEQIRDAVQIHLSVATNQTTNLLRQVAVMLAILLPLTLAVVVFEMTVGTPPAVHTPLNLMILAILMVVAVLLAYSFYRR